jgi:hypothetical protein
MMAANRANRCSPRDGVAAAVADGKLASITVGVVLTGVGDSVATESAHDVINPEANLLLKAIKLKMD